MTSPTRVLIVEDDRDIAQLEAMMLEAEGLEVHVVSTVPQAIAACEDRLPDVAVVDLQLPGGSGWEFVRQARDRGWSGVRVVVHSVHDAEGRPGVDAYVSKDEGPDVLASRVCGLLAGS